MHAYQPLLLMAVAVAPVFAQAVDHSGGVPSREVSELADLSLEELMQVPVESVSGVSKYQQSIRRAPAGVMVFTAADIRNYGWSTLSDVLRAAPGMHVRSDRFYDYVGTRGFTRVGDFNARTLILLNGHRLDDPIYQQGAIGTDFILDMDLVDRIEVISGPGSPVYGSNAFYGAVNVIPKTGRDISGAELGFTAGTEPSLKVRATVGDRTDDGVDYLVSATEWWSRGEDDFKLPASWRAVHPMLQGQVAKDRDDMHHQSVFTRVAWRGLSAEAAYVRRKKDVLPPVYLTPTDTTSRGIDERAYAILRATGEPVPDATFNAKIAVDVYSYEGLFTPWQTGFITVSPYADSFSLNSEVSWRQTFAEVQSFGIGVEYQENLRQDYGVDLPTFGMASSAIRESSRYISPFVQLDWEFTPNVRVSAGGRYDYYNTGDERFTPRLGLILDPTPSTTIKLLYGEAFRVPNVSERFPGTYPSNPDLEAETNRSFEFVAEQRLGSIWRIESHLYHMVSSDLIVFDPAINTYRNADRYVTQGFDIGPSAYFPSGLQLRGSVTIQETRDDSTDRIVADAPRTLAKLHVSTPVVEKWLRASVEVLYVGNRKDSGDVFGVVRHTGDYVTGNFTLRASRVWHRWDLALSIYNVADARWSDPKDSGQISSPPRSAVLRATLDF
jgi:Outer membrane receptor for ferrienterochelin and colicins